MKIGILFQIGNFKVWDEMKNFIDNFKDKDYILFIHFNSELIEQNEKIMIIDFYEKSGIIPIITEMKNIGMDIGGFFKQIQYIIENDIQLDVILKIHTKSNVRWRDRLIKPLIDNKDCVDNCLEYLKDNNVGMICNKKCFRLMDHFNTPILIKLLKEFSMENKYIDEIDWNLKEDKLHDIRFFDPEFYVKYKYNQFFVSDEEIQYNKKIRSYAILQWWDNREKVFRYVQNEKLITYKNSEHMRFCAGTIFWIRADFLINFFKEKINFNEIYSRFEDGYIENDKPTFTHSWERFLSIIVKYSKKKTIIL